MLLGGLGGVDLFNGDELNQIRTCPVNRADCCGVYVRQTSIM